MKTREQIKAFRKSHGITLCDLALRTGINYTYLSKIETGKLSPRLETVETICTALGCELVLREVGE